MKIKNLLLIATSLAMFLTGCSSLETYSIDAPDDLADKIADYKAEKDADNTTPDGAVDIEITAASVGSDAFDSAWWTEFSQYFTVPVGKKLVLNLTNYSPGDENYKNWVVVLTTPAERGGSGYSEYLVLRSDNYGWGAEYDGSKSTLHMDIDGEEPSGDAFWATFREKMQGAAVVLTIDHASEGRAYIEGVATATDGSIITETMNCPVSFINDINVFLVADHCRLAIEKAYLTASDYPVVPDAEPQSITITGTPEVVSFGAEDPDFWGDAVATVTFADGSSMAVDKEKLSISQPDLTVPGTKTVVVSYSYTKKGVLTKAVAGYYNFELFAALESLQIVTEPVANTYYYYDNTSLEYRPYGIELQSNFEGGLSFPVSLDEVSISAIELVEGDQDVTFTYKSGAQKATATTTITLVKGESALGLPTLDTPWWAHFTPNKKVPAGESLTYEMDVYSPAASAWQSISTVLRKGDNTEYAVVRIDNYGWGASYAGATLTNDWNWDLFNPMLDKAHVAITVTNNNTTATIRYDVLWANGEQHYQEYSGLAVEDEDDVYFTLCPDGAYAVFVPGKGPVVEEQDPNAIVSLEASATAYVIGGATKVSLVKDNAVVYGVKGDQSKVLLTGGYTISDALVGVWDVASGTTSKAFVASYTPFGGDAIVADGSLTITQSTQTKQETRVGSDDYSGGWFDNGDYATRSKDWTVAAGESQTVSLTLGSDNLGNWHSPSVVLRKADHSAEYVVVRMDHFGWGAGYDACTKTSNWDWDVFASRLNGSKITITVTVGVNNTASIRYEIIDSTEEAHYQYYDNIVVDGTDVTFAVCTEAAYMDFD